MLPELPCDIEGRYTVVAEIGRGSHAIVYQAYDRELERDVAVKVLREELVDSSVIERFRREIRLTSKLDHPHIAHVYGTGEWRGAPYFVIALARGPSLAERLAREHQLPVDDALAITRQVAAALGHAHRAAIIHRDVKPGNILLTPDGALLTDFGVARAIEHSASTMATSTGTVVGTLQYMSPEQLCAEKGIDGRSDQYELALVLYEMLAGVPPHVAANIEGLRALRLVGHQVPVRTHRPSVPVAVENAIERALCPTPADRFGSMGEFVVALDGGDSGSGALRVSAARRTLVPAASSTLTAQRLAARRWFMPGIVVLGVAAAGVLAAPQIRRVSSAMPVPAEHDAAAAMFTLRAVGDTARSAPIARALSDELSVWPEVQAAVSSATTVRDGTTPLEVRATALDDGTQVTAQVRVGAAVRWVMVRVPTGGGARGDSLRLLAGRVLMACRVAPDSAEVLTYVRERPTAAVRKFGEAWASVLAGALVEAEMKFAEAARSGTVPQAVLWQAIVGSWRQPKAPAAWREAARAAGAYSAVFTTRDALIVTALQAQSQSRSPEACDAFRRASGIDGGSFAAWYGLGMCQQLDSIVVADTRSPSGARFRTSHWSAATAFEGAIARLPAPALVSMFDKLPITTFAVSSTRRTGVWQKASGASYAGLPSVNADSIVVFPMPVRIFASGSSAAIPQSNQRAVRLGRERLLTLTGGLVRRVPSSVQASLMHARALEYSGFLSSGDAGTSALPALAGALRGARSRGDSIVIATALIRVHLRLGEFGQARAVGAQLLSRSAATTPDELDQLIAIAVLLSRREQAESLLTRSITLSGTNSSGLPSQAALHVARYVLAPANGGCSAQSSLRDAALDALQGHYSRAELQGAVMRWLTPGDWARLSCLGAPLPVGEYEGDPLLISFRAFHEGNLAAAAASVHRMLAGRDGVAAGSVAWDTRFLELWLLTQAGDSTTARAQLVTAVRDLSGSMDHVMYDFTHTAGLRRTLALCDSLFAGTATQSIGAKCGAAGMMLSGGR